MPNSVSWSPSGARSVLHAGLILGLFLGLSLTLASGPVAPARAADRPPPAPAPAVLEPVPVRGSTAPVPTFSGLAAVAGASLTRRAVGLAGAVVLDPATGEVLWGRRADAQRIPASTLKIMTAATALTVLGPRTRIATTVVIDGSTITLVGGGDTTLRARKGRDPLAGGNATLLELAEQVAAQVQTGPVELQYDASLFAGDGIGPGWPSGMPRLSALSIADAQGGDPARRAARSFASLLRDAGVTVTGITRGTAPAGATEIARVESAPVEDLVERMLTDSDNLLAESLGHLAGDARFGRASFATSGEATSATMQELGVELGPGARIADASGLSSRNRIPASALASLLAISAAGTEPALTTIASGLPVAGVTGTLADRFGTRAQRDAAGFVRAKTGTLRGVTALAGTVADVDGRLLAFAVLADDVRSVPAARAAVDEFASLLYECGCR